MLTTGSERTYTPWREADLEWLGVKPDQVQTSVFEMGREQPNAIEHHTAEVSNIANTRIFQVYQYSLLCDQRSSMSCNYLGIAAETLDQSSIQFNDCCCRVCNCLQPEHPSWCCMMPYFKVVSIMLQALPATQPSAPHHVKHLTGVES